jgi:hypothetical protein
VFYFKARLCLFSDRAFDAHLFTFFGASSYCSILFSRISATLSTINLFRAKKKKKTNVVLFFFFRMNATLSSGGIFDDLFFKWW